MVDSLWASENCVQYTAQGFFPSGLSAPSRALRCPGPARLAALNAKQLRAKTNQWDVKKNPKRESGPQFIKQSSKMMKPSVPTPIGLLSIPITIKPIDYLLIGQYFQGSKVLICSSQHPKGGSPKIRTEAMLRITPWLDGIRGEARGNQWIQATSVEDVCTLTLQLSCIPIASMQIRNYSAGVF